MWIFDGTEVCFDLLHSLSGLHWREVRSMNIMVSVVVSLVAPSMSLIASFRTMSS